MTTSASITKISAALLLAQREIGGAKKGAQNPFFHSTYADLGSIMAVCKEPLNAFEITVLQPIQQDILETVLLHSSGEWISSETKLVIPKINDPQAYGSAVSYARRYALQSLLFIPAVDDDGEAAMDRANMTDINGALKLMQEVALIEDIAKNPERSERVQITIDGLLEAKSGKRHITKEDCHIIKEDARKTLEKYTGK